MSDQQAQVDAIVREVLRRLAVAPSTDGNALGASDALGAGLPTPRHNGRPAVGASASNGSQGSASALVLTSKVITLAELDGRLDGLKRIRVPRRAVITPAVRDLLRQREIAVEHADALQSASRVRVPLAVGVAQTAYDPAGLLRSVMQQGVEIQRLAQTGLLSVIDELTEQVSRGGSLGLLLTEDLAAALCLANRVRGVRAAASGDVAALGRAIRSIGVNLLVVEPAGRSPFQLRQMVTEFCRGPYTCPAEYRERLS
jgi:hypothetical protein